MNGLLHIITQFLIGVLYPFTIRLHRSIIKKTTTHFSIKNIFSLSKKLQNTIIVSNNCFLYSYLTGSLDCNGVLFSVFFSTVPRSIAFVFKADVCLNFLVIK